MSSHAKGKKSSSKPALRGQKSNGKIVAPSNPTQIVNKDAVILVEKPILFSEVPEVIQSETYDTENDDSSVESEDYEEEEGEKAFVPVQSWS